MKLADRCQHAFASEDRERGQSYFDSGAVDLVEADPGGASSFVGGSRGNLYEVDINWDDAGGRALNANCTCPRYADGVLCKHVWATILALDSHDLGSMVPGFGRLEVTDYGDVFGELGDTIDEIVRLPEFHAGGLSQPASSRATSRQRSAGRRGTPKPAKQPWQRAFDFIDSAREIRRADHEGDSQGVLSPKHREAWYILDVGQSVPHDGLVVSLHQRERKMDGEFGKLKRLKIGRKKVTTFSHAIDRELMEFFVENSQWSIDDGYPGYRSIYYGSVLEFSTLKIPRASFDYLLPRLAATDRFVWMLDDSQSLEDASPITYDDGPPWQLRLSIEPNDKQKRWFIRCRFDRHGHSRPTDEAVLVADTALLFNDGTLGRLETELAAEWLTALGRQAPVEVPYREREDFLKQLWSTPTLPPVDLPDDLAIQEVREPPRPKLKVHAPDTRFYSEKNLYADVSFLYGKHEVAISDDRVGIFESADVVSVANDLATAAETKATRAKTKRRTKRDGDAPDRVILRDRDHEQKRLANLEALPFRPASSYFTAPGELEFHRKHLTTIVEKLTAQGWQVEAEGKLFRSAGAFNIEVTSGIDWFELDAAFDFDGVEARLPELLAAVRKGAKYVQLDDGTQGILPDQWLARYANLANLGEAEDGKVRFKQSQALLIDALLAERDAETDTIRLDQTFKRFRQRLQSFDGVKPKNPTRSFEGKLREYQREGLGWFDFLSKLGLGGCLADDMGLGKTVQVLALLEIRRTRRRKTGEKRRPSLVVVPKSLVFNWIDEAQRFTPQLRVADYTGIDRKQRVENFDDYHLIVTTYGTLRRDIVRLKDHAFDYAILDEAQAIKNSKSQAAKASLLLNANHRLALTGTPIENHLGELWSLFEFLNPGMLGMSNSFASLCRSASRDNHESLSDLAKAVAPFILRRTKDQVLKELPAKTEQTLHCELSPKERKAYDELRDFYRAKLTRKIKEKGLQQSKIHVLEALLRLRQASCHLGLVDKKKAKMPSAKLETLLEQVREVVDEGHKALVFSQFTSLLAIVRQQLDDEGIRYEYLDGKTRKRKERVENFQTDPACPLFLISLKAGGHGLNLTAADYVFILDPWWNPAAEAQAIDRTHRIGQTRRVFAYRIIAVDTVEEKVLQLQDSKRDLANAIITANDSLIRKLTAEDLKMILS